MDNYRNSMSRENLIMLIMAGAILVFNFVGFIVSFFVWKEFKGAPKGTVPMIATMFVLFVVGLVLITLSN